MSFALSHIQGETVQVVYLDAFIGLYMLQKKHCPGEGVKNEFVKEYMKIWAGKEGRERRKNAV